MNRNKSASRDRSRNFANRTLYHGDNLGFLRGMNSGTVDLIATDPPFNKGRDFHATPDSLASGASFQDRWSWEKDVHEEWTDKLEDDFPDIYHVIQGSRKSYGDDMGAFLCFMGVRLVEMKRVLKPSGSIYMHCDPTASHYLKELMDAVFGVKNFRNEIVWSYKSGGGSKRQFGKKHDTIFWYSKSFKEWTFNADDMRIAYSAVIPQKYKHKFHEKGKIAGSVWDIARPPNHSAQWVGYPTQKPLDLYERIIRASSNEGDIVLDPFCGCATTCVAAERLGRQWVGMDIWDETIKVIKKRFRQEGILQDEKSTELGVLAKDITFTKRPPARTDDGLEAVPFLAVPEKTAHMEPPGRKLTRKEMVAFLIKRDGKRCKGCNRDFGDDTRYLQLDHNTPRSQGGLNHESNRMLLCAPCNQMKSDTYTLKWLQRENKKHGYWQA